MDVNVDAGYQRTPSGTDTWHGVAGSLQWTPTARVAISPRYEWFHDVEGFTTGTAQILQEGTLTGQYTLFRGLVARGEFRIDQSDEDVFPRGMTMVPGQQQVTGLLSLIGSFGSLGR